MRMQTFVFLALAVTTCNVFGKLGYGHGGQDWGFVEVREGAHMFYWLYETTAKVSNYTERPLVIWLQGGPGSSSAGYGNFQELGPLDVNGKNRTSTWVKDVNVLFIDNPVGSGFSYLTHQRYFATTDRQITLDLLTFLKSFYSKHPEFEKVPLHIFSESYGGKMATEFALELHGAIEKKEIKCNFASVVLGDAWISAIDSILAWGPLLYNTGIVDQSGLNKIMEAANKTLELVQKEDWSEAAYQYGTTAMVVDQESKGVNIYNIVTPTKGDKFPTRPLRYSRKRDTKLQLQMLRYDVNEYPEEKLETLMRGPVTKALGIPNNVIWGSQKDLVFDSLVGVIMKPVVDKVSQLLDKPNFKVGVMSGQLDLVCATTGTLNWVDKLQWQQRTEYVNAPRNGINVGGILEGYEKTGGKLSMFWINRAGHMATADNPAGVGYVVKKMTNYDKTSK